MTDNPSPATYVSAAASPATATEWRSLSPIPDRVGFAGMAAGILSGRLVVGGGSQFPDKPLWLNGEKLFSDRIFVLAEISGAWNEHSQRLPKPLAHFATAASDDAIYMAGGCDAAGTVKDVYVMRADGDAFAFTRLPDLPRPIAYGASVIFRNRLYVAGGQEVVGSKSASETVWSLDISPASSAMSWRAEPSLDKGVFVAAMSADDNGVYVLGGVGFDSEGKSVQSKRAFRLGHNASSWSELPAMPAPRVGAVSPCPVINGRIFVAGGYASAFSGERRDHPGFNRETFFYDVARKEWAEGPALPHVPPSNKDSTGDVGPAPMVAAPGIVWQNHFVIIGGEVRASVRTPAVVAWPLPTRR